VIELLVVVVVAGGELFEFMDEIEVASRVLFEFVCEIVVAEELFEFVDEIVVALGEVNELGGKIVVAGGVLFECVVEFVFAGDVMFEFASEVVAEVLFECVSDVVAEVLFEFVSDVVSEVLFEFIGEIVVAGGVLFEFVGEIVVAIDVLFEFVGEIIVPGVLLEFVGEILFPDILVEVDEFVTGITVFPAAVLLELITVAGMLVVLLTGVLLEFIDEVVDGRAVIGRGVVTAAALLELAVETVDNTVADVLFEFAEEFVTGISVVVGTCIIPQMFEKLLEINGTPIARVGVVVCKIGVDIVGSVLLEFDEEFVKGFIEKFSKELAVVAAILL